MVQDMFFQVDPYQKMDEDDASEKVTGFKDILTSLRVWGFGRPLQDASALDHKSQPTDLHEYHDLLGEATPNPRCIYHQPPKTYMFRGFYGK